jgi:hypothetical protein
VERRYKPPLYLYSGEWWVIDNIVTISKAEFDRIKDWERDKLIEYLIQIYGDNIKQAIIEGFAFKIEEKT